MDSTTTVPEDNNSMNQPQPIKKTGLGNYLKSAREAMQLTEKEAAVRLHLNAKIISLIEDENFMDGPPAAFIRGYVRSYAKLLNVPDSEITLILKDLESFIFPGAAASIPFTHQIAHKKQNERYFRWLTYAIVLTLAILVSVWWSSHSRYSIADIPPAQPAATPQPIAVPLQNATVQRGTNSKPLAPALISPSTAPEQTATQQKALQSPPAKPEKKSAISTMDLALPEPGMDNENNND